jgi:class 3 adenylate cyclase/predicted ATPase
MTFEDILDQALAMLQRRGRVTYGTLQQQFALDAAALETLKDALLYAHPQVVDDQGRGLRWTGDVEAPAVSPAALPSSAPRVQPDAERRQLTVMFCDMADSTKLSGQLDPEEYRDVVRAYQATCTEVIQRFDGYVAQLLGDGLLVYFGYPQAHEDDAQRAVRTGLGILAAMEDLHTRLQREKGIQLGVRIGIHTGLVVVGEMGGAGRQEHLALGEVPNLAARLQGLATSNTLVVSHVTHRLIQGYFECQDVGAQILRGVSEPAHVYRVLQESGARGRLDVAVTRGLTPLVGRESEVALLLERWEQVKAGQGQVVLLTGDAGIGKSRLVQVLKDHVANEPHMRWECRSSEYYQNTALFPLTDLFQRLLRFRAEDTLDEKVRKLEQMLNQYRLPLEESVLLLAPVLSLPLPDDRYPLLTVSPQRQRQKTLETIVALLLELAERQPVLFIIEDLHWTDPSTLELLNLVIEQTPTASLLTVLTCRPTFQPTWSHRSYLTEITVHRLSHAQVEQIVTRMTDGKTLPHEVLAQIIEKTDGVPLFVEEMTKAILESGQLKALDDHYIFTGSLRTLTIPATLQDSLMARLDRLGTAKAVAQYAAVIGRQFAYDLLLTVSQLDEAILQRELGRLVEAELVYQRGVPSQSTYVFKHALIRDAAYDSLLRSRRSQIHGQIARVLERDPRGVKDSEPETIALHFEAAQEIKLAIGYWELAGRHARERSANQEAATHFSHAIELLSSSEGQTEQAEIELRLRIELGGQLIACHGNGAPEVEVNYAWAQTLLDEVHDRRLTFRARHGLRTFYMVRGPLQRARELGQQLLELAHELDDDTLLLQSPRTHGLCLFAMGELELAQQHLEYAIALYRSDAHNSLRFEYISDPLVLARCNLGWVACFLGDRDRALDQTNQSIAFAEQLNHKHSLAFALSLAASTRQALGDLDATQALAERLLSLATDYAYPYWVAWAQMLLGWVRGHSSDWKTAAEEFQQGLHSYRETGARMMLPYFLVLLSEVHMQRREHETALGCLQEAERLIGITGTRFYATELHRLKGDLLLQQSSDNAAEAETCFHQALDVARNQQAKSLELRAATSLARLWQQQGKRTAAHDLLAPVYGWFTEGFDTADLQEAQALLAALA